MMMRCLAVIIAWPMLACDLGVHTRHHSIILGAGAHGGERLQSDFLKGLRQAAHVVGSMRTATLFRATEDESVRAWVQANAEDLKTTIEKTKLEWNDDKEQLHCALVHDDQPYMIRLSRPRCQNITSSAKAGELIIHEAVHMMGIGSESFAPAVAYALYLAWEYSGHTLDQSLHSITTELAPSGREGHTAAWTGLETVFWGGMTRSGETSTGGYYDHVLDRWRPVTQQGAPMPRYGHTAIWSGQEMIVWGGAVRQGRRSQQLAHYADGGRLDPQNNQWHAISKINAPSHRFKHSATWVGKQMLIFGGARQVETNQYEYLDDGYLYNPQADTWSKIPKGPSARFDHTAIWTGPVSHQLLVWGGQALNKNGQSHLTQEGWILDLRTLEWKAMPSQLSPEPRYQHTAVWTGSRMIIWGGTGYSPTGYRQLTTGGVFDLDEMKWSATNTTASPFPRAGHSAVWTGSHMLIFGGKNPVAIEPEELAYTIDQYAPVGLYEPVRNEWTTPIYRDVWMDRKSGAGVWTGHEFVIWGGEGQRRSGRVLHP